MKAAGAQKSTAADNALAACNAARQTEVAAREAAQDELVTLRRTLQTSLEQEAEQLAERQRVLLESAGGGAPDEAFPAGPSYFPAGPS